MEVIMKKNNISNYKFIDLFAGIGGFRIALESFGLKCVYSSEWDKHAQKTYQANFNEIPDGDITKKKAKDIPKHNILCGGFPCQAFSISGKQRGFEDTRGTLFFDIVRIIKSHKPEILFLENVKNFEKHDNGRTLKVVISNLKKAGYNVFYRVLNASHYGAPTSRQRIYFICFRKDLHIDNFEFPKTTNEKVKLIDYLDTDNKRNAKYTITRKDIKIEKDRINKIKPDLFDNYPQKPLRIGTINKGGQGERIYSPCGHAITLSAYGGGVASKTGAYLINGVIRKLTPRECARIMGFPETFIIPVDDNQAFQQFGNSVAIQVLKKIFNKILIALEQKNGTRTKRLVHSRF